MLKKIILLCLFGYVLLGMDYRDMFLNEYEHTADPKARATLEKSGKEIFEAKKQREEEERIIAEGRKIVPPSPIITDSDISEGRVVILWNKINDPLVEGYILYKYRLPGAMSMFLMVGLGFL